MIWQFIISLGCESQTFINYLYMQYCVFSHQKHFQSSQSTYSYARSGCNTSRVNSHHFLVLTNKYKYVTLQTGTTLLRSYLWFYLHSISLMSDPPPPQTKKNEKKSNEKINNRRKYSKSYNICIYSRVLLDKSTFHKLIGNRMFN